MKVVLCQDQDVIKVQKVRTIFLFSSSRTGSWDITIVRLRARQVLAIYYALVTNEVNGLLIEACNKFSSYLPQRALGMASMLFTALLQDPRKTPAEVTQHSSTYRLHELIVIYGTLVLSLKWS